MGVSVGDDDDADPLFLNVAGFTCAEYTSLGKQKRGAGVHNSYYYAWRYERKELAQWMIEDLFVSEKFRSFPSGGGAGAAHE